MKKKVLITGVTSFTGQHLENLLSNSGFDVYGTTRRESSFENHLVCELQSLESIREVVLKVCPDYVIHLAGISFPAESNFRLIYDVNFYGTLNLLEALSNLSCTKKLILSSSANVYGNQETNILSEAMCPSPINHYGVSKLAMEHAAKIYSSKIDYIITRVFNYTGIGQADNFLIPKIIKHFREKKTIIELGNLDIIREFNDVEFVCEAYKQFLISPIKNQIINICSGRGIKLMDIIEIMNEIAGYKIEIKINPAFIRKEDIKSLTGSIEKLSSIIGPIKQKDFSETLRTMYEA